MFWPFLLPLKITFWILVAFVAAAVALAPKLKWKRGNMFLLSTTLALLAFVPSCAGIMYVIDGVRFGHYEYETFADVNDFRAERWLPDSATQITMHKHSNGYRARYSLSESEFTLYLEALWDEYGEVSAVERGGFHDEGSLVRQDNFDRVFGDLGWELSGNATVYYSPTEPDGGGATYYFDAENGIAFQRTGYW